MDAVASPSIAMYVVSTYCATETTVKLLNFRTPDIFAIIYLKFKQRGQPLRVFGQNGANGIANSEDPDQTAPLVCPDIFVRKLRVITVIQKRKLK